MANLLPHEYVHSWCGKFRRPAGMCTPNFQTPMKTRLLWVYEGLAEYLGEILMVRSGLIDAAEYRRTLPATIGSLSHREGRKWRSLEDTGVASHLLRGGSPNWNELRREQDYYFEGALIWLEADTIIRERSKGKYSLDDFCRRFLGGKPTEASVEPYELSDVVAVLRELADFDWDKFLLERTTRAARRAAARRRLPLRLSTRVFDQGPERHQPDLEGGGGGVSARDSIGLSFDGEGKVVDIVPGMVGDRSGHGPRHEGDRRQRQDLQRTEAPRRPGRQRREAEDRIPPDRRGALPHDRPRLCRRPALSRAGPRLLEAGRPGRDPQADRRHGPLIESRKVSDDRHRIAYEKRAWRPVHFVQQRSPVDERS